MPSVGMEPSASQTNLDNNVLSQFLSFLPTLQTLTQHPNAAPSQLTSFINAVQTNPSVSMSQPQPIAPATSQSVAPSTSQSTMPQSSITAPVVQAESSITQAPRIVPYNSVQMLNAVASSSSTSASTSSTSSSTTSQGRERVTTASGFPSFTMVQRANDNWLAHAYESLPNSKRKPWGKAKRKPSLVPQSATPKIDDCLAMAKGGTLVMNLEVNIYPPQPPTQTLNRLSLPRHLVHYQCNHESFLRALTYAGLTYRFSNLPVSTTIVDLMTHLCQQLQRHGYSIPEPATSSVFAVHEQMPLQLLAYTNLGCINATTKTPRLATGAISSSTTLQHILANKREYAIAKLAVTSDNHFELNMIVRTAHYPLELNTSLADIQMGNNDEVKVHCCISKCIFSMFLSDVDARISEGVGSLDEDEMEASCDEGDDVETGDESVGFAHCDFDGG
ncbi:hypothetical protein AAF712_012012 [Marasmius tenuissimus]|uniref:Uncharacterized protein n=1 Tax=Marasmius tenuissimus TaxID=585030 RepID=A0ABR2ZJ00_9AGAR